MKSLFVKHPCKVHCNARTQILRMSRILSVEELKSSGITSLGDFYDLHALEFRLKFIYSEGMPKVVPPSNADEDWLLWYQYRDENFAPEIVRLSTGRIAFAKSKDGLTNWNPVPVLGPNKESGDWFVACFIVASFT